MDFPTSLLLYGLLVVALGLGFLLGRRERRKPQAQQEAIRDYYQGLNFLLGERPELGVDRFIQAMEVNDESIDVHLALAGVVRRRGEVAKAIRIHQNLLASPTLKRVNKELVEYELARDYHAAGLLDRAEALLVSIIKRKDNQFKQALDLLVDIYEQEKDWEAALEYSKLALARDIPRADRLAHFYCELGEREFEAGRIREARDAAAQAMQAAGSNPRGHWLAARIDIHQKSYKKALKNLNAVAAMAPDLVVEIAPMYAKACQSLGSESEYLLFLEKVLETHPSGKLLNLYIETRRRHGLELDVDEVLNVVERMPDRQHLALLMDLMERADEAHLPRIKTAIRSLAKWSPDFQCQNCGFRSHVHLWHCPTCKQWGRFNLEDLPKNLQA